MSKLDLSIHGISVETVKHNLSPAMLYEDAMRNDPGTNIADNGALVAYSGEKTGRSPKDKRVARNPESENDIWWGPINFELTELAFQTNLERAKDYLNSRSALYVIDGYAGWDPKYQLKVRIICARAYHALFMWNMMIIPTREELEDFGQPDFTIYNAGQFPANRYTTGMSSKTSVGLSFEDREVVILGTQYAGEMKKSIFTIMNYLMPKNGVLSMHCSATANKESGRASVLFGLSGTGKTTLSADPNRDLVGDDEHCWSDDGIFNIEGGCYAKAINLTAENEPDIFNAVKFGAVMENVIFDDTYHHVDYTDTSITENTRVAYPIEYIENAKVPCVADHPTDVIFLTCDAFGVLPPASKLTNEQAMYHFISGYTAKVGGTEMGIKEPQATFSPCFGGPFLVWHPVKYAEMLAEKMEQHKVNAWLVNTGWAGGAYGVGSRIKLKFTRAIIDAIHSGELNAAPTQTDRVFGLHVVTWCPGVPHELMLPENAWEDKIAYSKQANHLAELFNNNFQTYVDRAPNSIINAGPVAYRVD